MTWGPASLPTTWWRWGVSAASCLPPVRRSEAVIGEVTRAAAAHTGLRAGTPVVAGCADHIASAYVAGVREAGDCLLKFGGAGDIMLSTREPRPDRRLFLDFHIVPGLFMPNGCMACSGALLNWFVRELGGGRDHKALDALAAATPPGADGLVCLPYFLGEKTPIHDPDARGVFMGLTLSHTAGHLWRALLEAVGFGFRHHIEVARELGYPVTRVLASDGGAASQVWMQAVADILQMPVQLLAGHPGSCLGAAWVAAVGVCGEGWDGVKRFVGRPAWSSRLQPGARCTRRHSRATGAAMKGCNPYFTGQPPALVSSDSGTGRSRPFAPRRPRLPGRRAGARPRSAVTTSPPDCP